MILSVRLPNNPLSFDFVVLDDTGATYLSLNYPDDFVALGLLPNDPLPVHQVTVETANGRAIRNLTFVWVNLKDDSENFMGQWREVECVLNPGNQTRLSGMYLRNNLYTAKAPDGIGRLFIGTKKNSVVAPLPIV